MLLFDTLRTRGNFAMKLKKHLTRVLLSTAVGTAVIMSFQNCKTQVNFNKIQNDVPLGNQPARSDHSVASMPPVPEESNLTQYPSTAISSNTPLPGKVSVLKTNYSVTTIRQTNPISLQRHPWQNYVGGGTIPIQNSTEQSLSFSVEWDSSKVIFLKSGSSNEVLSSPSSFNLPITSSGFFFYIAQGGQGSSEIKMHFKLPNGSLQHETIVVRWKERPAIVCPGGWVEWLGVPRAIYDQIQRGERSPDSSIQPKRCGGYAPNVTEWGASEVVVAAQPVPGYGTSGQALLACAKHKSFLDDQGFEINIEPRPAYTYGSHITNICDD